MQPPPPLRVVIVEPARMRIGLWGYPQGDICASYTADCFSLSKTVRNPFTHDHGQFVIMDGTGGHFCVPEVRAYPIIHESYLDDVKAEVERIGLDDSYVARPLKFRRQCCILGIPKIFRQRRYAKQEPSILPMPHPLA